MGFFGRRQQAVAVATRAWQPDPAVFGEQPYIAPAADMYDDGCAGDAYGAEFVLDAAPFSTIRVWAYPVPCGPGEYDTHFEIGYRIEYRVYAGDDSEPWLAALYSNDGPGRRMFGELGWASDACHEVAHALAGTVRAEDSPDPLGCFDWDGAPW